MISNDNIIRKIERFDAKTLPSLKALNQFNDAPQLINQTILQPEPPANQKAEQEKNYEQAFENGRLQGLKEGQALSEDIGAVIASLQNITLDIEKSHQRVIANLLAEILPSLVREKQHDEIASFISSLAKSGLKGQIRLVVPDKVFEICKQAVNQVCQQTIPHNQDYLIEKHAGPIRAEWAYGYAELDLDGAVKKVLEIVKNEGDDNG